MDKNLAPGPWKAAARHESKDYVIRDAQGAWIATVGDRTHAARIVACVKFCDGFPTKTIQKDGNVRAVADVAQQFEEQRDWLADALRDLIGKIEVMNGCSGTDFDEGHENEWPEFQRARHVLIQVKP